MNMYKIITIIIGYGLLVLIGCTDPDPFFEKETNIIPPVSIGSKTVFVNQGTNKALLLDSTLDGSGETLRVQLSKAPIYMEKRKGKHSDVLILSEGHPGDSNHKQKAAALTVLNEKGNKKIFKLGNNPFDTIISDPEGEYVVLLRRTLANKLLKNINEIAIIKLGKNDNTENSVLYKTLEGTPQNVFYSEDFKIDGKKRKIACIVASDILFLIDLEHLNRRPTTIYLGKNNTYPILAEQEIFDNKTQRIYVRSSNANDIFALKLTTRKVDTDRNDFATALDIIGVGKKPSDMAFFHEDNNSRLFVVSAGDNDGSLIDVATGKTTTVPFHGNIDSVYLFTKKTMGIKTQHALVWEKYGRNFYVLDFKNLEDQLGKNIRFIGRSYQNAKELLPVLEGNRLLLMHNGHGLSIIDLDVESISPFASKKKLSESYLDEKQKRFWIAPHNQNRVAYIDINEGETDDLLLDDTIKDVVPVFDIGVLLIVHGSSAGYVTLIDVKNPTRDASRSIKGFILEDIL